MLTKGRNLHLTAYPAYLPFCHGFSGPGMHVARVSSLQVSIGPVSRDPGSPKAISNIQYCSTLSLWHPEPACAGADQDPPFGRVALLESGKGPAILGRCRWNESLALMHRA